MRGTGPTPVDDVPAGADGLPRGSSPATRQDPRDCRGSLEPSWGQDVGARPPGDGVRQHLRERPAGVHCLLGAVGRAGMFGGGSDQERPVVPEPEGDRREPHQGAVARAPRVGRTGQRNAGLQIPLERTAGGVPDVEAVPAARIVALPPPPHEAVHQIAAVERPSRSRRQVTSTRSGVYRARASKSPSQCRTGRSARTANAPMGQSMRTRTVSPRRRHCRYSTAARSKSPGCIGRAGLRHRRERRSPCGATSAGLSSPLRFRPARFSAPPLPRGPSSRTAGHPVPASRRGSAG